MSRGSESICRPSRPWTRLPILSMRRILVVVTECEEWKETPLVLLFMRETILESMNA
jgi:hypothetical protein